MTQSTSRRPPPKKWRHRIFAKLIAGEACLGVPLLVAEFGDDQGMRARVAAALGLILSHAPAEFTRIQTLMRGIVVMRLYSVRAEWREPVGACFISLEFMHRDEATAAAIAAVIVHELMHARLYALGFEHREGQRRRIERICDRRSQRFLNALPASPETTAALDDVEERLSLDSGEWSNAALAELRRQQLLHVRIWRGSVRRALTLWHRARPT